MEVACFRSRCPRPRIAKRERALLCAPMPTYAPKRPSLGAHGLLRRGACAFPPYLAPLTSHLAPRTSLTSHLPSFAQRQARGARCERCEVRGAR